ncbi:MAG: hypothetical protein ACK4OO_06155, partial [bacterium]
MRRVLIIGVFLWGAVTDLNAQWLTHLSVDPPQPREDQEITTIVRGNFPDNTFNWVDQSFDIRDHTLLIVLRGASRGGIGLPILVPWEVRHNWGRLAPGEWRVFVQYYLRYPNQNDFQLRGEMETTFRVTALGQRHSIPLRQGWNLVSSFINPDPDDIPTLFAPLVERGTLLMVKDPQGRFYNPHHQFNNIPYWEVRYAYFIKVTRPDTLWMEGQPVEENTPILLSLGWNGVAYFLRNPVPAPDAFASIREILVLAKDGEGHFYDPSR